jgi:hypothetical protein
MSSWVVRLGTQSVASLCSANNRFAPLLTILVLVPGALLAQLTTGTIEGALRDSNGHPVAGSSIVVSGAAGFRTVVHPHSNGEFAMTLPYGRYRLSGEVQLLVLASQIIHIDLVIDASGTIRAAATDPGSLGTWTDATRGQLYPEAVSLQGLLLSREPSSVTAPLDFTGLSDSRLGIESQRGFSWTDTQYKLQGMDATDSYQPGLPAVLPDVQALEEAVVRSAFAQTTSSSYGTEVGLFLAEPGPSWHGAD